MLFTLITLYKSIQYDFYVRQDNCTLDHEPRVVFILVSFHINTGCTWTLHRCSLTNTVTQQPTYQTTYYQFSTLWFPDKCNLFKLFRVTHNPTPTSQLPTTLKQHTNTFTPAKLFCIPTVFQPYTRYIPIYIRF